MRNEGELTEIKHVSGVFTPDDQNYSQRRNSSMENIKNTFYKIPKLKPMIGHQTQRMLKSKGRWSKNMII